MYLKVKVKAGAKKEVFEQIDEDTLHISVKEKAEKHRANRRVCNLIAEKMDIDRGKIQIITGHHYPNKILFIRK